MGAEPAAAAEVFSGFRHVIRMMDVRESGMEFRRERDLPFGQDSKSSHWARGCSLAFGNFGTGKALDNLAKETQNSFHAKLI
jgi:hypothetical protein